MTNISASADQKLSTPPTLHASLIADLISEFPEVQAKGFWKALRGLRNAQYMQWLFTDNAWWSRAAKFTPDAFVIHEEKREIIIFEVVVSHDISTEKFQRIVDLAYALDEDDFTLSLIRTDIWGSQAYPVISTWVQCNAAQDIAGWKSHFLRLNSMEGDHG